MESNKDTFEFKDKHLYFYGRDENDNVIDRDLEEIIS